MNTIKKQIEDYYPVMSMLDNELRQKIEAMSIESKLTAGTYMRQSECSGLFLLIEGKIKIEKIDEEGRQTNLYEIEPGELCHENLACYLACQSFNIIGHAVVDTTMIIIPQELVKNELSQNVNFLTYAYQMLHKRLHYMVDHKASLIHEGLEERLINYLKHQNTSIIYMTHQAIALELSSSREVISRKLKELEKQGKIQLERGKIKLLGI